LIFNPGVNLAFSGSYKIEDYGTFNCLGSAGNPVVINGQGYSRVDYTNSMVEIKDGASANLQYTNFTFSPYHLLIRNASGTTVSHCNFSSFGYNTEARAVTVYNSENSVNINNCSFTGSGSKGIGVYALNTGTDVAISDNTFTSCRYGIRCYSSDAFLTGNSIQNSYIYGIQADYVTSAADYRDNSISHVDFTKWGIFLNSSSPYLMYNYIYDCRVLINGGSPDFATRDSEEENWRGYNTVTFSAAPLIKVQNYASPFLGYGGADENGGYNSIYECDLPQIMVENHSNVLADYNYWGPEGPMNHADGTSTITDRYPLPTNPNPERSLEVLSMNTEATEFEETPVVGKTSTEATGDEELFNQALQAGYKSEYEKAKEFLKGLIDNNSGSKYAALSVVMYHNLTKRELRDPNSTRNKGIVQGELNSLLADLIAKPKEHTLRPFGLRFQALEYALARNYDSMISLYDRIIVEYPDTFHELAALYDAIAYHVEIKCDFKKAEELLARMDSAYPDEELTFLAHILVGENKEEFSRKSGLKDQTIKSIFEFRLNQAFPNPFNPQTTISFDLPKDITVSLEIFDITGRKVRTLLNKPKEAGTHQVIWNGQDDHGNSVASGLYVYRIQAGNFVQSKKMLFMK
jgi:tetratricopeptide (TPR) repeat protein